jgi:hypothetical protein
MKPEPPIEELRARVSGPVLRPADPGFAEETSGFNLANSYAPAVAVGVTNEADVVEAVRFAAEHDLPVRVLATGHGPADPVTDGVLVVTRRLSTVSIDADARVATIGAGVKWEAVQAAAAPLGLTAITGSSPDVGAIGLTLGGGLGPLLRSHGYTSDYAESFRVVTGEGEAVTASAEEHPELFWALRGGKGGLGVVTELRIRLVPLPVIFGGSIIFDEPHIEAVLRGWIEWTATAPDEVTTSVAVMYFPPIGDVPELLRGRHCIVLRFAFPGSTAEGERLVAPLRALASALLDTVDELPTSMMGLIHNDPTTPLPAWDRAGLLDSVDQDLATALLEHVGSGIRSPLMITELRHLGGAGAVDVPEGSAAGGREGAFSYYLIGVPDPSLFETVLPDAAGRLLEGLAPWVSTRSNVNFAGRFTSEEHYRSAWPAEIFARLETVKQRYDPHGLFTFGPPAG